MLVIGAAAGGAVGDTLAAKKIFQFREVRIHTYPLLYAHWPAADITISCVALESGDRPSSTTQLGGASIVTMMPTSTPTNVVTVSMPTLSLGVAIQRSTCQGRVCPRLLSAISTSGSYGVYGVGTDNALYSKTRSNSVWSSNWVSLSGFLIDPPSVSVGCSTAMEVFVIRTDRAFYHQEWGNATWGGWNSLSGVLISPPSLTARGAGLLDVFAVGSDGAVWSTWCDSVHPPYASQGWQACYSVGGSIKSLSPSCLGMEVAMIFWPLVKTMPCGTTIGITLQA
jgi:hypothetical protein